MELYMRIDNMVQMIIESVEIVHSIWPTIEEKMVVTMPRNIYELTFAKMQFKLDFDVKQQTIILQVIVLDAYVSDWMNSTPAKVALMENLFSHYGSECFAKNSMISSDHSPSYRPTKVEVLKELPKVSMEKGLVITALKDELRKLKGKDLADNVVTKHTIAQEMLKIGLELINPRLLNNRSAHSDYLKHTQEEVTILKEIVE
ncbi:hypothetical protein Tco_0697526 [Tanacetum coccineum]